VLALGGLRLALPADAVHAVERSTLPNLESLSRVESPNLLAGLEETCGLDGSTGWSGSPCSRSAS
jgi:hypothetical protein